jgi:outer membrane biosynthesis protein TonB
MKKKKKKMKKKRKKKKKKKRKKKKKKKEKEKKKRKKKKKKKEKEEENEKKKKKKKKNNFCRHSASSEKPNPLQRTYLNVHKPVNDSLLLQQIIQHQVAEVKQRVVNKMAVIHIYPERN